MYGTKEESFHLCMSAVMFNLSNHSHNRIYSCHGPALYPGVIDATTGKSIISGKTITGFTTEAEYTMKVMDTLKSWGEPLVEDMAAELGAKCLSTAPNLSYGCPRLLT